MSRPLVVGLRGRRLWVEASGQRPGRRGAMHASPSPQKLEHENRQGAAQPKTPGRGDSWKGTQERVHWGDSAARGGHTPALGTILQPPRPQGTSLHLGLTGNYDPQQAVGSGEN